MTVYQDPDTEKKLLFMYVLLHGGVNCSAVNFNLGEGNGSTTATISYPCPKLGYNWNVMFESELEKKESLSFHPLVVAVKKELKNHRESVDSIPECKIQLNLPIPVKPSPGAFYLYSIVKNFEKLE